MLRFAAAVGTLSLLVCSQCCLHCLALASSLWAFFYFAALCLCLVCHVSHCCVAFDEFDCAFARIGFACAFLLVLICALTMLMMPVLVWVFTCTSLLALASAWAIMPLPLFALVSLVCLCLQGAYAWECCCCTRLL